MPHLWKDVTVFGAVGDGVADDTAPIQAAINATSGDEIGNKAGYVVYFPSGIYKTTAPLTRPGAAHNLVLRGDGKNASVLRPDAGVGIGVDLGAPTNVVFNSGLYDLGIEPGSPAAMALRATNFRYLDLKKVYIKGTGAAGNTGKGIQLRQDNAGSPFSGYLEMQDCEVLGSQTGLEADGVITASYVFGNKFTGDPDIAGSRGVSLLNSNVAGWAILKNEFEGHTEGGIYTRGTQGVIGFNRFETNALYHIKYDGVPGFNARVLILGNAYTTAPALGRIVTPSGNDSAAAGNAEGITILELDLGLLGFRDFDADFRILAADSLKVGTGAAATPISQILSGTAVYNPPSIANEGIVTTTVSVSGASVGDAAMAAHSGNTNGRMLVIATVTGANTVTVAFFNKSGGTVNLPSGTLRVWVIKA